MRTIHPLLLGIHCFASATAQQHVIIYEGLFDGAQATIEQNWNAVGPNAIWNDKIRSIRVPEGRSVILYEDVDYQGAAIRIDHDWEASQDHGAWANRISSIAVEGRPKHLAFQFSAYTRWGGNSGRWERAHDIRITNTGSFYWGSSLLHDVGIDPDMSFHWSTEDGNSTNGCIHFVDDRLSGWVQYPGEGKLDFQGEFIGVKGIPGHHGSAITAAPEAIPQ